MRHDGAKKEVGYVDHLPSSLAAQEMRAGPSDSDCRIRVQTPTSCFSSMAEVVSVAGKGGQSARQVSHGKTNASKPPMMHRKYSSGVVETRGDTTSWDQARREPVYWPGGNRCRGGVIPMAGSCAEHGNLRRDAKGDPKGGGPAEGRVPMRDAGADGFVIVMRPGNTGGAKGPDLPAKVTRQPETGGADD